MSGRNVAITGKEIAITAGAADEGVVLADVKTGEVVATADKAPYLMTVIPNGTEDGAVTLRDGAGEVHVVEVVSARRECMNCRAPHTAATGDGRLEITLVGGKKGDCRFTASRKVKIAGD